MQCVHALGLYKQAQVFNAQIFRATTKCISMYLWYKQPGLNSRTPKNLKELVVFGNKMKEPTKCRTGVLSQ